MPDKPQIVVLTPTRNEEWILPRFLAVTSRFADLILVADQGSTDRTRQICGGFDKVRLLDRDAGYNELERQRFLIGNARELVPGPRILLALDADEILAGNAMKTMGWQTMLNAEPGTVLSFEKPDLLEQTGRCIRYDKPWPLGYVDDGTEHHGSAIHSIRIPTPEKAPNLSINDVKILHYALVRSCAQRSKMRLYSVLENSMGTQPLRRRLRCYRRDRAYCRPGDSQAAPREWFEDWEATGIDMTSTVRRNYYWHDFEILGNFSKFGARRFWWDDIWDFDWEKCRIHAQSIGMKDIPPSPVPLPPPAVNLTRRALLGWLTWHYGRS